jgi:predicted transcriptional regulator
MRITWAELKAKTMTPASIRKARVMAEKELAEIELSELRAALDVTQVELANRLKVTQTAISRLEGRKDWHLSTLSDYVEKLGGELEVRAVFPERSVRLTHVVSRSNSGKHRRKTSSKALKPVA